jgi:GT2 family glycosyltransferase
MKAKKVLLKDVLAWVRQALEAAQADLGDAGGDYTALSYRKLHVTFSAETGDVRVHILTRNQGFAGCGERKYYAITHDGAEVVWEAQDQGIVTGADWLPREFVEWMVGKPHPQRGQSTGQR